MAEFRNGVVTRTSYRNAKVGTKKTVIVGLLLCVLVVRLVANLFISYCTGCNCPGNKCIGVEDRTQANSVCIGIKDQLPQIISKWTLSRPGVYILHEGDHTLTRGVYAPGSRFCAIFAVPQEYFYFFGEQVVAYEPPDQPLSSSAQLALDIGPDQITAELQSEYVIHGLDVPSFVTLIENVPPYNKSLAIYSVGFELTWPGVYEISANWDSDQWKWRQIREKVNFIAAQGRKFALLSPLIKISEPKGMSPIINSRPRCYQTDGNITREVVGSWFNDHGSDGPKYFDYINKETSLGVEGWKFVPDNCNMRVFNKKEIEVCLASSTIQVIGGHVARRLLRALISGGYWCFPWNFECTCQDNGMPLQKDTSNREVNLTDIFNTYQPNSMVSFGKGSRAFYDPSFGLVKDESCWTSAVTRNAVRNADIVLVDLVPDDIADDISLDLVEEKVRTLKKYLLQNYNDETKIVVRLAENFVNGQNGFIGPLHDTMYSKIRFDLFNAVWNRIFSEPDAKNRIKILDASILSTRLESETGVPCMTDNNGYLTQHHIITEMQLLLNMICY